ncbi:MAG: hypothetical protein JSW16_07545 [Dehalococcoidales bacterium]|nr:MAG: hypothetical protein JSW16_07545 [Dehalococcoidales bacterium]
MADELPPMTLKAIGIIRNEVKQAPPERDWWQDTVSEIVIEPGLTDALEGLEDFSNIIVLW